MAATPLVCGAPKPEPQHTGHRHVLDQQDLELCRTKLKLNSVAVDSAQAWHVINVMTGVASV